MSPSAAKQSLLLPSSLSHIVDWLYLRQCIFTTCVCRGLNERVRVVVEPVVLPFPQHLVGFIFSQNCRAIKCYKGTQTYHVSCLQCKSHSLQVILTLSHSDTQISRFFQHVPVLAPNHTLFMCIVQGMLCMRGWGLWMRLILVILG